MEVLSCAYGSSPPNQRHDRNYRWSIFGDHAYRFDNNGRVAEIRDAKELMRQFLSRNNL